MIEFKKLDIEDKDTVRKYVSLSGRRNCDLSFANLYCWRFLYLTEIAEHKGFLLIRFYPDHEPAYMFPVGKGFPKEVMQDLMHEAQLAGKAFRMFGICKENVEEIEHSFPGMFKLSSERDYADYVYLRSNLATLQGKKLQSKRNHVNKFKKTYPNYELKPLTPALACECMKLEAIWCKANNCHEDEMLQNERKAMSIALKHITELDITGMVLCVNGQIAGFTYGTAINPYTFDTCVEKADTSYEGAYAMINQGFACMIPEEFTFINREEDLGIEGLRKAKLSYHPDTVLEKFSLIQI